MKPLSNSSVTLIKRIFDNGNRVDLGTMNLFKLLSFGTCGNKKAFGSPIEATVKCT